MLVYILNEVKCILFRCQCPIKKHSFRLAKLIVPYASVVQVYIPAEVAVHKRRENELQLPTHRQACTDGHRKTSIQVVYLRAAIVRPTKGKLTRSSIRSLLGSSSRSYLPCFRICPFQDFRAHPCQERLQGFLCTSQLPDLPFSGQLVAEPERLLNTSNLNSSPSLPICPFQDKWHVGASNDC